jgi:type III pantothenate kinase
MKILVVDAGNSRIKWGWSEDAAWQAQAWLATAEAGALGAAWTALPQPDRIVVSNVAGAAVRGQIAAALALRFRAAAVWIAGRRRQCGVVSSYGEPEQLGADRWAALIGAWHRFHGPCLVVGAGTTVTVDALSGEGVFLGGLIVPGFELMRTSLARNTAQLGLRDGNYHYFPDSTADAIASGAVNALCGAIERMLRFMQETGEVMPFVALSGGDAGLLADRLNARVEVVDNLVLEGLLRIALDDHS